MTVRISGQPTPVANPAFAGLTIRVPLDSAPSKAWLDLLALQDLPGKGHRLVGGALDFHLDRGAHDVRAAMRRIALAMIATNAKYLVHGQQLDAGENKAEAIHEAAAAKVTGQLEEWWAAEVDDVLKPPVPQVAGSNEGAA
jgi:hypothetical protein